MVELRKFLTRFLFNERGYVAGDPEPDPKPEPDPDPKPAPDPKPEPDPKPDELSNTAFAKMRVEKKALTDQLKELAEFKASIEAKTADDDKKKAEEAGEYDKLKATWEEEKTSLNGKLEALRKENAFNVLYRELGFTKPDHVMKLLGDKIELDDTGKLSNLEALKELCIKEFTEYLPKQRQQSGGQPPRPGGEQDPPDGSKDFRDQYNDALRSAGVPTKAE